MSDYIIKEATTEHDLLCAMHLIMLGSDYKTTDMHFGMFSETLANRAIGGKLFLIKLDGVFMGAASVSPKPSAIINCEVVRIHRVCVHPKFRRLGIAKTLIKHICDMYRDVDAASESEEGFKLLRNCFPYKRKSNGSLSGYEKKEGFKNKHAWVFSNFEPSDKKTHARAFFLGDQQQAKYLFCEYELYAELIAKTLTKDQLLNNNWILSELLE